MALVGYRVGRFSRLYRTFLRSDGGSKFEEIDEKSNGGSERTHDLRSNDFEDADHDDQWDENDPKDHANEKSDYAEGKKKDG